MKLYGHAGVRILNCSRDAWRSEGRRWSSQETRPAATSYSLHGQNGQLRAGHTEVASAIGDPASAIVDVRSEAEYRGERFWPSGGLEPGGRAGHVPSAVHQPIDGLYHQDGSFRSAAQLLRMFAP